LREPRALKRLKGLKWLKGLKKASKFNSLGFKPQAIDEYIIIFMTVRRE